MLARWVPRNGTVSQYVCCYYIGFINLSCWINAKLYSPNSTYIEDHQPNAWLYSCLWWRHEITTFSPLLVPCEGNPPVIPSQRPVTRVLMFPLIHAWTNSWANISDACGLRCHLAHYDDTAMQFLFTSYAVNQLITLVNPFSNWADKCIGWRTPCRSWTLRF